MSLKSFYGLGAVVFSAVLLFSGCAGNTHIEKDKNADFSKYHTYAWVDKTESREERKGRKHDLTETNVRNAVNKELQKNGWREVRSNPDVLVNYELLVEKNLKEQQDPVYSQSYTRTYFNRYNGRLVTFYYPPQFMGYDSYSTTVKEGTVTITMIDNRTDKTVWQGWTTNELYSGRMTGDEIDQSVRSIFRKFDP